MKKLANEELNRISKEEFKEAEKTPIIIILDDIRSLHNIGSVFRTCDAFLVEKIYYVELRLFHQIKKFTKQLLVQQKL